MRQCCLAWRLSIKPFEKRRSLLPEVQVRAAVHDALAASGRCVTEEMATF
jgi:hypothetical protein